MGQGMWMGPRGGETWVPSTKARGGAFTRVGWSTKSQQLNGRARVRHSSATHMEYSLAWNDTNRRVVRTITDMYSGKRGRGRIYLIDPMQMDQNILNEGWSLPSQACLDGVPLIGSKRPTAVRTTPNGYDFPVESARYTVVSGDISQVFYLPIPPGHTAWFGASGEPDADGRVLVQPFQGDSPVGTATPLPILPVTGPTRFNHAVAANNVGGVEITIAATPGSFTLSGIMVQILPDGFVPSGGDYITGGGNAGCDFEEPPTEIPNSLVHDRVGITAKLIEVVDEGGSGNASPEPTPGGWRPDPANPGYLLP